MELQKERIARILLVEDNPADQKLTIRALKKGKIKTELFVVDDGEKALEYLTHTGIYSEKKPSPKPDMILLDINLPKIDGKEVLRQIRKNETLKSIPVIMLTTSMAERDIVESYQLGVNAYINKPVNINEFYLIIQKLEDFWFHLTLLPPNN